MSLTETPTCAQDPGARRRHAQPRDAVLWDGAPGSCDSAPLLCDSAHLASCDSALLFGRSWGSEGDSCPPSPGLAHSINSCHAGHGGHMIGDLDDDEPQRKRTILAENEVEANKVVNNYRFGFRKWKSHVTERPFEGRSEVVKELYSELNQVKTPEGSLLSCGNLFYVLVFGWFLSLVYLLVSALMFITVIGSGYGKLCFRLSCYFLWPFGKPVHQVGQTLSRCCRDDSRCSCSSVQTDGSTLLPSPLEDPEDPEEPEETRDPEETRPEQTDPGRTSHWCRPSTYLWLILGLPLLALAHVLVCVLSWILVFTVPVSKMSARTLTVTLLLPPEDVYISSCCTNKNVESESKALLCCYSATNWYYYKYTVDGINIFAVNLLPLVVVAIVMGYVDPKNHFSSSEVKFAVAVVSIIPLSYYIGMGIASVSAQSNFAVGAVVNATFGSITELTFYITALLRGHRHGNACLQEVVKSALTGTLLGCILFIPGICMVIGGLRHSEQRFNCRSTAVSSALLFISVGGVFTPTLFSKAYSSLVCESCSSLNHSSGPFTCSNCHLDMNNGTLFQNHVQPLVYTMSALLPSAYVIGLLFTLKTHRHIYNIQTDSVPSAPSSPRAVVHWSRWRSLLILVVGTVLMSACADLATEHIQPILSQPNVSQFFIGVTVIAMVPEIPEIITGIQFALQNNISLSLEVGSCIAVQVCMIQIPLLVFFNAFWDVGFVLIFSDLHLWSSIFAVVLVNYIFMDGKCDYFQGTALVVVYLILLALYYFAPSPKGC